MKKLLEVNVHAGDDRFEDVNYLLKQQEENGDCLNILDIKKKYDNGFEAVKGVSIKMYKNQIFALLGHNGAGKTTTLSMLFGLLTPSAGNATVFGLDINHNMQEIRKLIGVCP